MDTNNTDQVMPLSAQTEQQMDTEQQQQPELQKGHRLVDVIVTDDNTALNLMVNFLTLAHKKGAFSIAESAKIWECIRQFQR
jgi:hypothetical protein